MMNILTKYQTAVRDEQYHHDPAQAEVINYFHALTTRIQTSEPKTWVSRICQIFSKPCTPIRGLYLWGDVGRGKTWLMDMFFNALPFEQKLRLHFRHFMQEIHDELTQLSGQRDPLPIVAKRFAHRTRILCLDEFYVEDITDAMLLYRLLDALNSHGIILVFTSNLAPDELYKNGLQRDLFLPAIDLIKTNTEVIELSGDCDYRLRTLTQGHAWFSPLNTDNAKAIDHRFNDITAGMVQITSPLIIKSRTLQYVKRTDTVAWFDFSHLCHGPRASADYIELARQFDTILVSDVPCMGENDEEGAHRFIDMVDEFYDRRVNLLVSANEEPIQLYHGRHHTFDFQRTVSRLLEMRSNDYLAEAHRP